MKHHSGAELWSLARIAAPVTRWDSNSADMVPPLASPVPLVAFPELRATQMNVSCDSGGAEIV